MQDVISEKRKKLKREGKEQRVDEDDPGNYKHAVYVMTMKLFADMERKRRDLEQRDMEERKRKREQEIEEEEKATIEKEWQKNFEDVEVAMLDILAEYIPQVFNWTEVWATCWLVLLYPDIAKICRHAVNGMGYNGWEDHHANQTIPPFWLDDRPPLLQHVDVSPAAGWSVLALHGL
ncbi:hypothetical protein ANN_11533 [Periplaneta americana]|uniref:Uncharacterized protein n=1 Tax=Periplaneta americana TaxID=6978 RepID=A0ABQ8T7K5_PERAM|nr:hypothetical protein ANN_11533 [Periplaneta americana]